MAAARHPRPCRRHKPQHLVGIYRWHSDHSDVTYLRFAFTGRVEGVEGALRFLGDNDGVYEVVLIARAPGDLGADACARARAAHPRRRFAD